MKKRIISIALVVVMIVAMIPATLLSASASVANDAGFNTYYHSEKITVDAERDSVYLNSEKISAKSKYGDLPIDFNAWISATAGGLYVYAEIADATCGSEYLKDVHVSKHDKFQFYFTNDVSGSSTKDKDVHYIELDYFANNKSGDTFSGTGATHVNTKNLDTTKGVDYATKILDDGTGWVAEIYVPWASAIGDGFDTSATAPYACYVGIQVNNDDNGTSKPRGFCYSNYTGTNYYNAPTPGSCTYLPLAYNTVVPATYNTAVTTATISLDGKLDDAYLKGTKINNGSQWSGNKAGRVIKSTAYTTATLAGLYVWVEVDDTTMNNVNETNSENGDMVQMYMDWTPEAYSHESATLTGYGYRGNGNFFGGWIAFDYEGNIAGVLPLGDYAKKVAKVAVDKYENPDWDGKDAKTQYIGYALEAFIPWNDAMKNLIGEHSTDAHIGIGFQISDDETYNYGPVDPIYKLNEETTDDPDDYIVDKNGNKIDHRTDEQKKSGEFRTSITFDTAKGGSYYAGYEYLPNVNLVYDEDVPYYNTFIADKVASVTLDGTNTNGEYDNASVVHVNIGGSGTADDGDIYRVVYTDDAVYILMESIDNTPIDFNNKATVGKDKLCDYIDLGISFGSRFSTMATFNRGVSNGTSVTTSVSKNTTDVRWYNYKALNTSDTQFASTTDATKWTYEFKIDLTAADKAEIAAGTFDLRLATQFKDVSSSGAHIYKYDQSTSVYQGNQTQPSQLYGFNKFLLRDNVNSKIDLEGITVNVDLGQSINLNLYADLPLADTDAQVKVTFNEKEYYLSAKQTDVAGEYKFTFENIAPQALGDVIVADLIVDGQTISLKKESDNFTVAKYLEGLKDDETYGKVVNALLLYGAAAQQYTNYKTDAPVADLSDLDAASIIWDIPTVKAITVALDNSKIAAAGVHFANVNKLYVKVETDNIANVTLTAQVDGGASVALDLAEVADGVYIAYTDGIKATGFGDIYTFTLTDIRAENPQTLTYSVNSYANAKTTAVGDSASDIAVLCAALYNYGAAAEALN